MKNWLYKILLRNKQKKILFELEMDLKWLETFKGGLIKANEDEMRDRLAELRDKENRDNKDNLEIENIANNLAELKVVKSRYQQTKSNVKELRQYIAMLSK